MKRFGNLWPSIVSFDNLLKASRQAQKGKRFRPNVLEFNYHLDRELIKLQRELQTGSYTPGAYRTFEIVDPKRRIISAAPYRDRVVHHALCNIIVPLLDATFIADTYANRTGFGTHKALQKFVKYARSSRYILQCDIRKYFPSIDREILKQIVRRKLKCQPTLALCDRIIDSGNDPPPPAFYFPGDDLLTPLTRKRGLPIGNLTSQFFANLYLANFDRFVKQALGVKKYLRFVDDFALFGDDRQQLAEARTAIEAQLTTLRLKIHPIKSQLFETRHGATFLGFRIHPDRIRICAKSLRRGRQRLRHQRQACAQGRISQEKLLESVRSWEAHLAYGDTWTLRQQLFADLDLSRR